MSHTQSTAAAFARAQHSAACSSERLSEYAIHVLMHAPHRGKRVCQELCGGREVTLLLACPAYAAPLLCRAEGTLESSS